MPVIKLPKGVTPEAVESSMPFPGGIGALYISSIPGPIRQIAQQAIKEGKDPAKVVASYLRGPYAPSKNAAQRFVGKGETLVSPDTTGAPKPSSGLKELGGLLGILAALFSGKSSMYQPSTQALDITSPYTDLPPSGTGTLKNMPPADELVKNFSTKPVGPRAVKAIKELAQSIKPEDSVEVIEAKADVLDRKYFPELRQEQATELSQGGNIQPAQEVALVEPIANSPATSISTTSQTISPEPTPVQTIPEIQLAQPLPTQVPSNTTPVVENQPKMTPQQEFDAGFREATRSREEILQDFLDKFAGYK